MSTGSLTRSLLIKGITHPADHNMHSRPEHLEMRVQRPGMLGVAPCGWGTAIYGTIHLLRSSRLYGGPNGYGMVLYDRRGK